MLEKYTKDELVHIVDMFNIGLKIEDLKKSKKDLMKMLKDQGVDKEKKLPSKKDVKEMVKADKKDKKSSLSKLAKAKGQKKITDTFKKPVVKAAPKKPLTEKQKQRKENYEEEDENLKLYEEGKKEMNEKQYNAILKRYKKLDFNDDDNDDLIKRLKKQKKLLDKKDSTAPKKEKSLVDFIKGDFKNKGVNTDSAELSDIEDFVKGLKKSEREKMLSFYKDKLSKSDAIKKLNAETKKKYNQEKKFTGSISKYETYLYLIRQ